MTWVYAVLVGTIPACAGEPDKRNARAMEHRDDPRVRGGTVE